MAIEHFTDTLFSLDGISVHVMNIIYARHTTVIPSHSHGSGCWEIHYIPTGHGTLLVNDKHYSVVPGTIFITGPHIEHAQKPDTNDPMKEYCIYLRLHHEQASSVLSAFCSTPFWFSQDDGRVHTLMQQIFDESNKQRTGHLIVTQLLISQLLIELSRRCELPGTSFVTRPILPVSNPNTLLIEECFLYEYATITLPLLAGRLGLSTRQTQRLLQETYSSTFRQMKTEAQMSAAISLLYDSSLSITAISERLGFSSPEHFSNSFRHYFGISPRAYRKNLMNGSYP